MSVPTPPRLLDLAGMHLIREDALVCSALEFLKKWKVLLEVLKSIPTTEKVTKAVQCIEIHIHAIETGQAIPGSAANANIGVNAGRISYPAIKQIETGFNPLALFPPCMRYKMSVCNPGEGSHQLNHAGTLILNFQPPELCEGGCWGRRRRRLELADCLPSAGAQT